MTTTTTDPRALPRPHSTMDTADLLVCYTMTRKVALSACHPHGELHRSIAKAMQQMRYEFVRRGYDLTIDATTGLPTLTAREAR